MKWPLGSVCALILAYAPAASAACEVTQVEGVWIGTEALKTGLPPKGALVFKPGGAGSMLADGALRMKFLWIHQARGRLQISGRRLDGDAPPLRSVVAEGFEAQDIQPTFLIFPTTGCWEVTGRIGEHRVTFVLSVVKIGDGPARVPEV